MVSTVIRSEGQLIIISLISLCEIVSGTTSEKHLIHLNIIFMINNKSVLTPWPTCKRREQITTTTTKKSKEKTKSKPPQSLDF